MIPVRCSTEFLARCAETKALEWAKFGMTRMSVRVVRYPHGHFRIIVEHAVARMLHVLAGGIIHRRRAVELEVQCESGVVHVLTMGDSHSVWSTHCPESTLWDALDAKYQPGTHRASQESLILMGVKPRADIVRRRRR